MMCADAIPFDTGYGATPAIGQVYSEGGETGYLAKSSGQFDGQGSGHDFFGTVSLPNQPMLSRKLHPSMKWPILTDQLLVRTGGGLVSRGKEQRVKLEGAAAGAWRRPAPMTGVSDVGIDLCRHALCSFKP